MKIVKRNGSYYLDYYFRGRRVREKVGSSKGAAVRARSVREGEILQGRFKIVPKRGAPMFEILADKYSSLVSIHKRGHHVERFIIKTLKAYFGKYRVSDLTVEDAEKYKTKRSLSVRPATVNRGLTVAKHMLAKAVEWKMITENPFRGVRNLDVPKRAERVLSADEEVKLLAACDRVRARHLRPLVVLALNTGLRRGELLSLEWARVDLSQRTVRVINTKSISGDRIIPMNVTVHAVLSERVERATSPLVFPSNRKPDEKFLDLKKGFHKAVGLAGISHIRFHDLRHTFATRLVRAGVDIVTVQKLLGHSKITMTERYTHSLADVKMAAVSKLDLAGVCSVPDPNRTPSPTGVVAESEVNSFAAST
jgi:integrase